MLSIFGVPYKTERIKAIAEEISKGEYDIYLLEELWMESDHDIIHSKIPNEFYMTRYREFTSLCDGYVTPVRCSGLAIISKFPAKEIEFNKYTDQGNPGNDDGEYFSGKGAGRVQIWPLPNLKVDIFITHTIAEPSYNSSYNNSNIRKKQVRELMNWISQSKADVVLLGGDFNAGPVRDDGSSVQMIRREMQNEIEVIFGESNQWLQPEYTTYVNPGNTFSKVYPTNMYDPIMYDYIFRKVNSPEKVSVCTSLFKLPMLKTKLKRSQLLKSIQRDIEEIRKSETSFYAYKSLGILESDHYINETKNEMIKRLTKFAERSQGLNAEDNEVERQENVIISLSDHEAITSTMHLWVSQSV